jgi:hypothetical protein
MLSASRLFARQLRGNKHTPRGGGSNTSTVSLRVVGGDEKGTQCLGL